MAAVVKRERALSAPQTANQPSRPAPLRHRPDQAPVTMTQDAYRPLKEFSEISGRTQRDLLAEAVTRLLVAHDQPVPPELRKKFRRIALGLA
jgi:hypothetical protein